MLLFDGHSGSFRTVKLRPFRKDCAVCGENPTISELQDYVQFCRMAATDKDRGLEVLPSERRVSSLEFQERRGKEEVVLVDTREALQTEICKIEGAWSGLLGSCVWIEY